MRAFNFGAVFGTCLFSFIPAVSRRRPRRFSLKTFDLFRKCYDGE